MRVLPWDSSPRLLREYGAVRGDSGERGADMMVELRRGSDVYRLCAGLGRARRRNAHAVNQQFVVEFYNFDLLKRTRSVRDAERRTERRTERMPRYRDPRPVNSQYRTNRDEWLMLAHPRWAVFWLFAIGELVGYKPCAILATSWWVSGDHGQCRDMCRDETL